VEVLWCVYCFPYLSFPLKQQTFCNFKVTFFIQISADGVDGEEIHLTMPPESEVSSLVATSELDCKKRLGIFLPFLYGFTVLDLEGNNYHHNSSNCPSMSHTGTL
jgi:hypothetical protein